MSPKSRVRLGTSARALGQRYSRLNMAAVVAYLDDLVAYVLAGDLGIEEHVSGRLDRFKVSSREIPELESFLVDNEFVAVWDVKVEVGHHHQPALKT